MIFDVPPYRSEVESLGFELYDFDHDLGANYFKGSTFIMIQHDLEVVVTVQAEVDGMEIELTFYHDDYPGNDVIQQNLTRIREALHALGVCQHDECQDCPIGAILGTDVCPYG